MYDTELYGDVEYEVWRRGGNPDAVDRDRVDDLHDAGLWPEEIAHAEYRRICGPTSADEDWR